MSITQTTGVREIETLYLQLLYRCNYSCAHCFHGENLKRKERVSRVQAAAVMAHFIRNYRTSKVVLLGGEPFLHDDIVGVTEDAHAMGLATEICTNGHAIVRRRLPAMVRTLDYLRISLDGLRQSHDDIRKEGSFDDAVETIEYAVGLGLRLGVTLTVTSLNIYDIPRLTEELADRGVSTIKLHQLRLVGNAEKNPHLELKDSTLVKEILDGCSERIVVELDDDLLGIENGESCGASEQGARLDRIEMSPAGGLTMSCKAVGKDSHAFLWDFDGREIIYRPTDHDEVLLGIPQVNYVAHS
ncbi:radical SAM protein [Amycolatopsis sp. NPDC051716]|uniref:radical SAM protein n=1 Tax=Amycolatopsis sp. NPDC051716 TaxID=3155804 RepID=UPI0034152F59